MSRRELAYLVFPAMLYLSACASSPPAPVVELSAPVMTAQQQPGTTAAPRADSGNAVVVTALAEPASATTAAFGEPELQQSAAVDPEAGGRVQNLNPAVVSLLNSANQDQQKGDYNREAASIERALKIEPDSAWLWHRLALARLNQGQAGQAVALAAKSNSLISVNAITGNRRLRVKNWLLIARVHSQRGEHVAAQAATARARQIQSGAG